MSRTKGRKRNIPMMIAGILLWLTMATAWHVSGTYAKYVSADSASDSARVASFVFNVSDSAHNNEATHLITLAGISKPGDQETYAFVVKNSRGSVASEVSEFYSLRVTLNGSIPLIGTLKKEGTDVFTVSTTGTVTNTTSGSFTPGNAAANSDEYTLTVVWPDASDAQMDADFANGGGIATIALTITGVQVN